MSSIRVLSLTQPWASLVAIGAKKLETRSWPCPQNLIGQRIAIHASKGFPSDARDACLGSHFFTALWPDIKRYKIDESHPNGGYVHFPSTDELVSVEEIERLTKTLPRGAVIATARLRGCWSTNRYDLVNRLTPQEFAFGYYDDNRWMWGLEDVEMLPEPIPAKGALGLWNWEMPKPKIMSPFTDCICLDVDASTCFRLRNGYDPIEKYGIPEYCECSCHEDDYEEAVSA
jgi:activating signal cointegrator 1